MKIRKILEKSIPYLIPSYKKIKRIESKIDIMNSDLLFLKENLKNFQNKLFVEYNIAPVSEKFLRAVKILENEYALKKSMAEESCVDKNGEPLPWYTYPAIEYIKQLDFSDKRVFEFGSGNSSLFWANISKEVISVEDDEKWYKSRVGFKKENMKMIYKKAGKDYYNSILSEEGSFDVIVIDGNLDRDRCCQSALKKIKNNGLIILDNTDWSSKFEMFAKGVKILKEANLLQVDFCGFSPINDYTLATSFFFKRDFDFKSKNHPIQPANIIGGIHQSKE